MLTLLVALGVLIRRDYHFLSTLALGGRFYLMLDGAEVWDIIFRWGMGNSLYILSAGEDFVSCLANGTPKSLETSLA